MTWLSYIIDALGIVAGIALILGAVIAALSFWSTARGTKAAEEFDRGRRCAWEDLARWCGEDEHFRVLCDDLLRGVPMERARETWRGLRASWGDQTQLLNRISTANVALHHERERSEILVEDRPALFAAGWHSSQATFTSSKVVTIEEAWKNFEESVTGGWVRALFPSDVTSLPECLRDVELGIAGQRVARYLMTVEHESPVTFPFMGPDGPDNLTISQHDLGRTARVIDEIGRGVWL